MSEEKSKEPSHPLDKIFNKWAEQGKADIAGFSDQAVLTIERSSGQDFPHEITDYHYEITAVIIKESTVPHSWFDKFEAMKSLVRVSFESCELKPGRKTTLPSGVTHLSIKRIKTDQIPNILFNRGETLVGLTIEEFVFDVKVFNLVKKMTNLKELSLIGTNPLGDLGDKPALESIHLSQLKLNDDFKKWVYSLEGLKKVEFSGTRFDRLPKSMIANAEELTVYLSEIKELPECKLKKLRHLVISNVAIQVLPGGYMPPSLESLDLSRTQIKKLPKDFSRLNKLKYLNLADSIIEALPEKIKFVSTLKRFDISNTQLKKLPEWLTHTNNLTFFGLAGCMFTEISEPVISHLIDQLSPTIHDDVGEWRNEKQTGMFIRGLTIKTFDTRYLMLPAARMVADYYFKHTREPAHEVRLFILGEKEKERKAVIEKILDEPEAIEEMVTAGGMSLLEVTSNSLGRAQVAGGSICLDSDARIHVYEMAEQDAYQAAHPMFFSDLSLYLVVLKSEKGTRLLDQAKYWANLVELKAPNSSLIFCVVENEDKWIFNTELFKKNLSLTQSINACSVKINANDESSATGFRELKSLLIREVKQMPAYTWEVPLSWNRIKRHVVTLLQTHSVISWKQFEDICQYYHDNIDTLTSLLGPLLRWLDETGVLYNPLKGQDHNKKEVFPKNLFDVSWLAACTYGVLRHAKKLGGVATARSIWQEAESAEDESFLETRFLTRSRYVMEEMVRVGLCLDTGQKVAPPIYLYPLFREVGPLPKNSKRKSHSPNNNIDVTKKWLLKAANPTSMAKTHYMIRCSVISEAFFSAFLLEIYKAYRGRLKEYLANHPDGLTNHPDDPFSLLGQNGLLVAFPPKGENMNKAEEAALPRSGSLFVTGLVGSPAEIHMYTSGTICPLFPESQRWGEAESSQVLDYVAIAIEAFHETLRKQSTLQSRTGKFTMFVEEELGPDKALIPLEDIKNFRQMMRNEYYCAPLNKTLDVKRAYEKYHPDFLPSEGKATN